MKLTERFSRWTQRRESKKAPAKGLKILLDLQGMQSKSRERGIGRLTRALAHAIIDEAGAHDVHVLLNEDLDEALNAVHAEFSARLPADHVHSFGPYGKVHEYDPTLQWQARAEALMREAHIAKLEPDMVHVGSLFEGFVDSAITSIGRLKTDHATSVTLYDLIPLSDPERYIPNPASRGYYLHHAQDLKRADLLLSISEHSKRAAMQSLQIPADRIAVIHAGVDTKFRPTVISDKTTARLRRSLGTDDAFLLHVGAADPRKNVGLILEAYMLLAPQVRFKTSVVFVGALSDDEQIMIAAAGHRTGMPENKIILLGLVDDIDLVALYTMCEALVFPSTNEGFGLPPLEAMACGVPALVANATSLPEVVGRSDCLFDPYDANALAERITRLSDPGWRRDLCAWGPKRARAFSWAAAGRRAIDAFESAVPVPPRLCTPSTQRSKPHFSRRPRMAFMSPLPPDRSGVADYSAELVRELLIYYDVDCIHPGAATSDAWISANCGLRDLAWFDEHADLYDRILYAVGNSPFHEHMLPRLARHPGVVVLHDAFLSDLAVYQLQGAPEPSGAFLREIYASHGLTGLRHLLAHGRTGVIADLTMSGSVFRNATGVIVHSHYARSLATQMFESDIEPSIAVVPLMRALALPSERETVRTTLSLSQDTFVICCFGSVHPRKMNRIVAEAFIASDFAGDRGCCLAFVGEAHTTYGAEIEAFVAATAPNADIRFVGHADEKLYGLYLQAADVALQLRTESRGETSGATLDAMAHGLAVIVSDIGAASELPDEAVLKVPVDVTAHALAAHLVRLRKDATFRNAIAARARDEIRNSYHPHLVGRRIHDLIETFAATSRHVERSALIAAISDIETPNPIQATDLEWIAAQADALMPAARPRQIFFDVSAIARTDLRTGIERVVRAVLERLIVAPPPGFRVEPTVIENGTPVYARQFVEDRLGLPTGGLASAPVKIGAGDHYLAVDWAPDHVPGIEQWLGRFKRQGGIVTFVVHDLLPLEEPGYFPDWLFEVEQKWLDVIIRLSNNIACVSRVVADSVASIGERSLRDRQAPLSLGVFHHGSDLGASQPTEGLPPDAEVILTTLRARPTILILGTVEPRKGHDQVVATFEALWKDDLDVGLVIVGKEGWMVKQTAAAIRESPMFGTKLMWLTDASDEFLEQIFGASVALIAASFGEGFGLPLIEAARHGLPLIARDLPVFHEVAGDHAFYFEGREPNDLAKALRRWLDLWKDQRVPQSSGLERQDWAQATDQLFAIMVGERRYRLLGTNEIPQPVDMAAP